MKRIFFFLLGVLGTHGILDAKDRQPIVTDPLEWKDWEITLDDPDEDGSRIAVLVNPDPYSNRRIVVRLKSCTTKGSSKLLNSDEPHLTYRALTGAEYVCTYKETK